MDREMVGTLDKVEKRIIKDFDEIRLIRALRETQRHLDFVCSEYILTGERYIKLRTKTFYGGLK